MRFELWDWVKYQGKPAIVAGVSPDGRRVTIQVAGEDYSQTVSDNDLRYVYKH